MPDLRIDIKEVIAPMQKINGDKINVSGIKYSAAMIELILLYAYEIIFKITYTIAHT